ncbi:hypothetical protein OPV22_014187 [Ensete ventricosum]|uniref:Uncharacterized protein n=1 Tax=Ensete ventricosum TaxID=4639 RepID=A0AAV8RBC6_ENSVE|nr:hypothetical protein OPV22_014187 [Ensete ventricosum]
MATRFVDGFAGRNGGKGCEGRDLCAVTARERMMSSLKCGFGNAELVSRGMTTECSFFRRCFQPFLPSYFIINFFRACAIHPKGVQSSVRPLEGQPFDLRGDSVRYPSLSVFPLFIEKLHASLALGWSQSPPPPSSTAAAPMETSQRCSNGSFSYGWSRNVRTPGESSDGGLRSSLGAQDSGSFIEMDPRFISR